MQHPLPLPRLRATVVVPSRNRASSLAITLEALAVQTAPPSSFEVLVVDNGSTDNTQAVVEEAAGRHPLLGLRRIVEPCIGPGRARNRGIQAAQGEYILFTDDDCTPEPAWVQTMLDTLAARPDIVGVEGLIYTLVDELTPLVHFVANGGGNHSSGNAAYRAEALRAIGGFDADAFPGANKEDVDLAYRMQQRGTIVFEPAARVFHPAYPVSFWWQVRRMQRLLPDELCMILRWPRSVRRYTTRTFGAPTLYSDADMRPYTTATNRIRSLALLARFDLLKRSRLLYARIVAMVLLRSAYGLWLLPGAVAHAWRHRKPGPLIPLQPLEET